MKLDHNCVRDVLLFLESVPYVEINSNNQIEFTGVPLKDICKEVTKYSMETIFYTLFELDDGGYISISDSYADDAINSCSVDYITYAGHEFINTIRSNPTWVKTLEVAGAVGNFGLQMLSKIAEGVATALIKQQLELL